MTSATQPSAETGEPLSPELEIAGQLLAEGRTDAAAALAAGRSAKWIRRARSNCPAFRVRVEELKAGRARQPAGCLGGLLDARSPRAEALGPAPGRRPVFDRFVTFGARAEAAEQIRDLKAYVLELRAAPPRPRGNPHSGSRPVEASAGSLPGSSWLPIRGEGAFLTGGITDGRN